MKNLIRINKIEIGFSLLNGFLGGFGTASGFVFTSLAALTALFSLTGSALLGVSIGALVVFVFLVLFVGTYFFNKSLDRGLSLYQKLLETNDQFKKALIKYFILAPQQRLNKETAQLENDNSNIIKIPYYQLVLKIKTKLSEAGLKESNAIEDTNLNKYRSYIEAEWDKDLNLQRIYLNYLRALSVRSSTTASSLVNSPTLSASVNSFINYGCSLGPSLGLIGALNGMGILNDLSTLAPYILPSIISIVIAITIIGAYGVYYSESRNMTRNQLIDAMEKQISCFTDTQKTIKLAKETALSETHHPQPHGPIFNPLTPSAEEPVSQKSMLLKQNT